MEILSEVKVIPEIWCNLFSITSAMRIGFKHGSRDMMVSISKGKFEFSFDKVWGNIQRWFLLGIEIVPQLNDQSIALHKGTNEIKQKTLDINIAHQIFGHPSEATTKTTAKNYGWKLTWTLNKCKECILATI